jgi:hypothetical protein
MDGNLFDRLVKALTASGGRRDAVKASLAGAMASLAVGSQNALAKKGKGKGKKRRKGKKRNRQGCSQLTQTCDSTAECCGAETGVIACKPQPGGKANCAATFPGRRCCGLDGVVCDPNEGHCSCCDDKECTMFADGVFRCTPPE